MLLQFSTSFKFLSKIVVYLILKNIFQIGGTYARPLIMPPEVAIGALGKISVSSLGYS